MTNTDHHAISETPPAVSLRRLYPGVWRAVGAVAVLAGLLVLFVPFTVSEDSTGLDAHSCGSVAFPEITSPINDPDASLGWAAERQCRAEAQKKTWLGVELVVVGAIACTLGLVHRRSSGSTSA